jgi:uncharacterized 2Fe-2S/4Fe-4S cluster protein (DUF4445 family)
MCSDPRAGVASLTVILDRGHMADLVHGGRHRPLATGRSLFDYADEFASVVPASCRRTGRCHECVVEIRRGAASLSARRESENFLRDPYRLACQAVVERADADIEFDILRRRLKILMPQGEPLEVDPTVTVRDGVVHYLDDPIEPFRGRLLGIALDVGTTTVVLELVDLVDGRTLGVAAIENPQRFGGSDVMARISFDSEHPGELRQALRRALNRELKTLYRELGVARQDVYEIVVVGNPTMRDLFFGLDVQPIGHQPYRSTTEAAFRDGAAATTSVTRLAHELGVLANPHARVYGGPLIACHVGADAAADLAAVEADGVRGTIMVIDIGSNTEVILGDGERYVTASCPAGPAFEGGLVRFGMPGAEGAIESVRLESDRFAYRTIGDVEPEGICGSGLVDVLAELRRAGRMTVSGAFLSGDATIAIVPERGITISREEVSHLAQAKAANSAGQRILLRRFGIEAGDVDRFYLAGGFANSVDVRNAIEIGLLAPVSEDRIRRVGNASVRGAKALLLSGQRRAALEALVPRIEHIELEGEPDFFDLFVDGCRFEPLPA